MIQLHSDKSVSLLKHWYQPQKSGISQALVSTNNSGNQFVQYSTVKQRFSLFSLLQICLYPSKDRKQWK